MPTKFRFTTKTLVNIKDIRLQKKYRVFHIPSGKFVEYVFVHCAYRGPLFETCIDYLLPGVIFPVYDTVEEYCGIIRTFSTVHAANRALELLLSDCLHYPREFLDDSFRESSHGNSPVKEEFEIVSYA